MLLVDLRNTNARLSMPELLASGKRFASNPAALAAFFAGVRFTPDVLLDERWKASAAASGKFAFFRAVMHNLLPPACDAAHLESLGGRFALQILGVANYTVMTLNRRVVTLGGLPVDGAGKPLVDVAIRSEAFVALFNDIIADLSEKTLEGLARRM